MNASKKDTKTQEHKKDRKIEEREEDFLAEDDEEEEIVYTLADNPEKRIEEALAILSTHSGLSRDQILQRVSEPTVNEQFPTETHKKYNIPYSEGAVAPRFGETLIIRKPK